MSCARVKKYTASDVSKAERHNERKNETYENMNVIEERRDCPFFEGRELHGNNTNYAAAHRQGPHRKHCDQ